MRLVSLTPLQHFKRCDQEADALTRLSRKELMLSCCCSALSAGSELSCWKRRLDGETGDNAPGSPDGFDCVGCLSLPGDAVLLASKLPSYVRFTMDDRGGEKSSCGTGISSGLFEQLGDRQHSTHPQGYPTRLNAGTHLASWKPLSSPTM